jgi:hypothetical protein
MPEHHPVTHHEPPACTNPKRERGSSTSNSSFSDDLSRPGGQAGMSRSIPRLRFGLVYSEMTQYGLLEGHRLDADVDPWETAIEGLQGIEFVRGGGSIEQVVEKRPEWKGEYRFYYKAILPINGFPHGVFVEIVLEDSDPDLPSVLLVSSHPQRRS